jgi:sodium-dependent dicarboxylate transporter 2/3/5
MISPLPPDHVQLLYTSTMMMLSLAFAANIGGTGTLIGTSPNLVFYGVIQDNCPGQPIK